jgi:hypothetical protein
MFSAQNSVLCVSPIYCRGFMVTPIDNKLSVNPFDAVLHVTRLFDLQTHSRLNAAINLNEEQLKQTAVSTNDLQEVFEEFGHYFNTKSGGTGDKLLTKNEINYYLANTQRLLQNKPELQKNIAVLQVLGFYFDELATSTQTETTTQQALSLKRLEQLFLKTTGAASQQSVTMESLLKTNKLNSASLQQETAFRLTQTQAAEKTLIASKDLQNFSFSTEALNRVFREADTYRDFRGVGNNLLTKNELLDYLQNVQRLSINQPNLQNDLKLLRVLAYYFSDLADIELQTGLGKLSALSLEQVRKLAAANGDPKEFTFNDISKLLGKPLAVPTQIDIARRMERSELIIQQMPVRVTLPQAPVIAVGVYHSDAALVASQNAASVKDATQEGAGSAESVIGAFENFSFDVHEVEAVIAQKENGLTREGLTLLLKLCFESIYQMEALQKQSSETLAQKVLEGQLASTRRLYKIATLLKHYFTELASLDGDGESISIEDIELIAAFDGDHEHFSLADLEKLKQKTSPL